MRIALTGASGHIGSCLIRELKNRGADVKALIHKNRKDLEQLDVEFIQGDVLNPLSLRELCEDVDFVFHLAAKITIDNRQSDLTYAVNVKGTENLLKAAKAAQVKRFVHFSSIHSFQANPIDEILNEDRPLLKSSKVVYEHSKAQSENRVQRAVQEGLDAVILNPTAIIGPYDSNNSLLGQTLIKIYENKLPMLVSGGYNWVDVRDVVAASISSLERGRSGEKYILSGSYSSLKELSDLIGNIFKRKTPGLVAPVLLAKMTCPFLLFFAAISRKDPIYTNQSLDILVNSPRRISFDKAARELNYKPRNLEQTLRDTFEWYKNNGYLN